MLASLGAGEGSQRSVDGKARLMDAEEFARFNKVHQKQKGSCFYVGKVGETVFVPNTEKHVLCRLDARRQGPGLIIPNLELHNGSVFVLDPKGENAQEPTKSGASSARCKCSTPSACRACPRPALTRWRPCPRI